MAERNLTEIAEQEKIPIERLRKHIQRGKLKATRQEDGRYTITDGDWATYLTVEKLGEVGESLQETVVPAKKLAQQVREIGNLFGNLPPAIANAILAGMPTTKKPGGDPEGVAKAFEAAGARPNPPDLVETSDDPHFGHPIGYQHKASPRWKRVSASTWELDGAKWSWNGFGWEGSGTVADRTLGEGVNPAAPAVDRRPLAPSKPVKR